MLNMETLKHQEEEKEDDEINQLAQKKTKSISFPDEIIQDVLSRLPVKPILQFRSVSKQWLSLISDDPSFPKLHFNRSLATEDRTSFFISAYDTSTNERHFLSAPIDGGPVTHLITLHNARNKAHHDKTKAEHLNGLVLFTSREENSPPFHENFAFVVNPATRKVFKVPPPFNNKHCKYFFGFDESNSEHKILSITSSLEFMIFSLLTYSWKKIHVPHVSHIFRLIRNNVCVNSVIHLMIDARCEILAFNLTTEKVSIINLPQGAIPHNLSTIYARQEVHHSLKLNFPFLIKDKDLLGVVCHDQVVETNKMHIWILQDYVNRVWVRETVTSPDYWIHLDGMEVTIIPEMESLVFSCRRLSRDMVNAFILDRKTRSFKLVNFSLDYGFLHSNSVKFHQVRSYVESILPLGEE